MAFQIEKNIPIPTTSALPSTPHKYNWDALEVGDSFFVPVTEDPKGDVKKLRTRVYNAARGYASTKGKNFTALVVEESRDNPNYDPKDENSGTVNMIVTGVRIWRTADDADSTQGPADIALSA